MVNESPPPSNDGPQLDGADVARLFPFYIEIAAEGLIRSVGPSIMRASTSIRPGAPLASVLEPVRPGDPFHLPSLRESRNLLCLIREQVSGLTLRGQWIASRDEGLLFIGSPWLTEAAELGQRNLRVDDFAIHDPAVDLLHILRSQKMATDDLRRLTDKLTSQRSQLKEANARLIAQEADSRKLALIAARTHNAVMLTDAQGRAEWMNAGFTRLTGYELDEIIGKSPGSLLQGPDTDPEQIDYMHRCIQAKEGFNVELINYSKSGRRYWVSIEVQPIFDTEGVVTHFMAIESDITSRRRAEADMQAQFNIAKILAVGTSFDTVTADVLRTLGTGLEWVIVNLWMHDASRDCLVLAQSWSHDDALRRHFESVANQPELGCDVGLPGLTWQTLQTQWVERIGDYLSCPRSNAAHEVGLSSAVAFPIHIGDLKLGVIELMSTRHEETDHERQLALESIGVQIGQFVERARSREELKRRGDELSQLNRKLEFAIHAKDDFLASISHEIRTPLNGVIGAADALGLTSLDGNQNEALATLSTSANHLHSLLNDVLDFSRIAGGHLELVPEPVLLRTLLDDVISIFQPVSKQKKLLFRIERPPNDQLAILADATRVRQVLVNLLGNAFKFTQQGSVRFSIDRRIEGDQVALRFVVEDSGIGIPPDRVDLLFKPFSQLDSTHTRTFGGTGLGLAISRRLAELMHGQLGIDTEVQTGSRFYFEIKVPRAEPPALPEHSVSHLQAAGDLLIVDDHAANATILSLLLRQLGLTAKHCPDAQSALAYCAKHQPPVIFMDVHMPQIDGFEATRLIRAATPPGQPRIPIIALTADVRAEVREASFSAEMDAFLSKPIRLTELRKTLSLFLDDLPATGTNPSPDSDLPNAPPPPPVRTDRAQGDHGLDDEIVTMMFEAGDGEDMTEEIAEMFRAFWEDVPVVVNKISRAQEEGQVQTGQALCHRLKGVLSNYGFKAASDILNTMETDAVAFSRPARLMALRATLHLGYDELIRRHPYLR